MIQGILEELRKTARIEDAQVVGDCNRTAENTARTYARIYLAEAGDDVAREILEEALAKFLNGGDVTSLSDSVPEFFMLVRLWPTPEYLGKVPKIGPNIKRLRHSNMTKLFFRSSGNLIRRSREEHGWDAPELMDYLKQEAKDSKNPAWAAAAAQAIKKAVSESK